jgi:hypothetical protein
MAMSGTAGKKLARRSGTAPPPRSSPPAPIPA